MVTGSAWLGSLEAPRFCAVRGGSSSFPPIVSTNLRIFCSCAGEIGRASSAAAQVAAMAQLAAIDIITTAATSNLFMRALMQLYLCKLYSAPRIASTGFGQPVQQVLPSQR